MARSVVHEVLNDRAVAAQLAVLTVVLAEPDRTWKGTEIAFGAELDLVDTVVALAVLTGEGRIERVAPGTYRVPTATPDELVRKLDQDLFGVEPTQ